MLTGVAILIAGISALAGAAIQYYYVKKDKENAALYFYLGMLSMIPEIMYLIILVLACARGVK